GPGPRATHSSPASHVPLQSGLVPPHGELGETQRQLKSNSESAHTPSPAHEPPHVGYGPDSHGPAGAPPWSATSEQSCIDAAVAFAATKTPYPVSFRMVGPSKSAQLRSAPVVMRIPTEPRGCPRLKSTPSFNRTLRILEPVMLIRCAVAIPAGAAAFLNL